MTWHDAMTIAEKLVEQLEGVPIQDQRTFATNLLVYAIRDAYDKGRADYAEETRYDYDD